MNVLTAIICKIALLSQNLDFKNSTILTVLGIVFTLPLFVSWLLLSDAFRRFESTKSSEQTINNRQVALLSISFLTYALAVLSV